MIRKNNSTGKPAPADPAGVSALLEAQRVIDALSPEDFAYLLEILDRQPRSAETVMGHIKHITKAEKKRLGMLLAQADTLPDYKVVKAYGLRPVSDLGLTGDPLRLFNYLLPVGSKHHEKHVIEFLWSEDAAECENIAVGERLRGRLRTLKCRTNQAIMDDACEIKLKNRELYIQFHESEG